MQIPLHSYSSALKIPDNLKSNILRVIENGDCAFIIYGKDGSSASYISFQKKEKGGRQMASWGPKLYQDDIAEDVKDYYKAQLKRGKTNEEVTKESIECNEDIIQDEDEAPVFWFALADTQWRLGRLLPSVKEKALEYLKSESNLKRWEKEAINQREYKIREKMLQELEKKLKSPIPSKKKISQHKLYKCEWNIGDTFAYKLESDYAKEKGFDGKYLIIHKVDENIWWPGHIIPIVYIKFYNSNQMPKSADDIENSEFVKATCARGKPEYRIQMLSTSKRIISNEKLIFIGNFVNLSTPSDEYIINDKVSMASCNWSKFEKTIVDKYLRLNLGGKINFRE